MQSTFVGGGGGGGLSRFSSAPATWLDALLEDDEDPLKPDQSLSHLLVDDSSSQSLRHSGGDYPASTDTSSLFDADSAGSGVGFLRQNSSPAEFLGVGSDAYFASFGTPVNYNYDLTSGSGKLAKDEKAQRHLSPKFSVQLMKKEERSLMPGGQDSSFDMETEKSVEDSVPCSVRAKRGCATHPRSIAERVRRTRISDRIRKLQELVPNMDKQTNTAAMLEEAVKYVKHLQKQIQELSENQGKCKCSVKGLMEEE